MILRILILLSALTIAIYMIIASRSAYKQKSDEIVVREPDERLLGAPQSAREEAIKDLPFARLSQSAYGGIDPEDVASFADACPNPVRALREDDGWEQWQLSLDPKIASVIEASHLRVEVWRNPAQRKVAVAFGGTVFRSGKDWKSNLRWFIPDRNDEYTQIVKAFAPAFVENYVAAMNQPEFSYLSHATLYATGHSLGGGLAQQFAYALPVNSSVPRVTHVFAFDPSPVTGYYSVDPQLRDINKQGLKIDRIFERGEILAILRSLINAIYQPSKLNPSIRQVRYNVFLSRKNPITGHSISDLTCGLTRLVSSTSKNP